jgi:integrase
LQWQDVDLDRGRVSIRRSYNLGTYAAPKTASACRTVALTPATVELLRELRPESPEPAAPVFRHPDGGPVTRGRAGKVWHRVLRELGIRPRGMYALKHTYCFIALSRGVTPAWLEGQTGVDYGTLRKHYARFMPGEGADELSKLVR